MTYDAADDARKCYDVGIAAKREKALAAIKREVVIGDCRLLLGDCTQILPAVGAVHAVVTDPPYWGVKSHGWDNQWDSREDFLLWATEIVRLITLIMANYGSLYWFCSPQMAAGIETVIAAQLKVLNSVVWDKGGGRKGAGGSGVDVSTLRSFWTANTERIVFAEKWPGQSEASLVFGAELRSAMELASVTNRQIASLFPSRTGGLTGCVTNWLQGLNVPTSDQWDTIARYFTHLGSDANLRPYYDLLGKYEAIRRPMNLSPDAEWGDVWRFSLEREQQHPTQKPLALMRHIITASTRKTDTVLDPFMGSGTTGVACAKEGRSFIGIEIDPGYFEIACERIRKAYAQPDMFIEARAPEPVQEGLPW